MRFDLYQAPAGGRPKYLLDVQSDMLEKLPTRIVVPLFDDTLRAKTLQGFQPHFEVDGERMIMMTQDLASVPKRLLRKKVMSLAEHRDEITRAFDLLFTGF